LKGGESEKAAVVPGDASKSYLMNLIRREDEDDAMPPKEAEKLTAAQVGWIEEWIDAGAPWPDDKLLENDKSFVKVAVSGALSEDWAERRYKIEDIWAFLPMKKVSEPESSYSHPIDKFLDAKLKKKDLSMSEKASKENIVKRAYLDLTGLKPDYKEIQDYVNNDSPDAYEELIDKLLASKSYGEQAARYWLDVVRYADTGGYANDWERPHVWRYRDYVIRSFNADKPFDQFVKEQIAGDEMDAKNPENILATGFLRTGPWEHTSMSVPEVTRQLFLDDVTETVGKTFLAQPLTCAKCHDHKFDPIPTQDYYRIQAVFSTTHFKDRTLPFQDYENLGEKDANIALSQERIAALSESKKLVPEEGADSIGPVVGKQTQYFNLEMDRYKPLAYSVVSGSPLPDTRILTGGSIESPGYKVTPGVLSAVHGSNDQASPTGYNTIPEKKIGRRLAFAEWVASEKNTLTSRVIVNRIWQQHFSKGIVATPNSFGKMGAKPTHPELLDYLADWFVKNGWSIKKLHKFIMLSSAYQMSTEHKDLEKLQSTDPDNKLLAYYPARRMQAEMIYDSLLKITGELNPEMGGPGIFPEINWEVALQNRLIMGTLAPVYQPSPKKKDRDRRQIYAFTRRSVSNPLLEVFNKPGSELSCAKRDSTTVTPQAFSLFNSEFIHNRSLALANTIAKKDNSLKGRINKAYKMIYGRFPTGEELKVSKAHIQEMLEYHKSHKIEKQELPKYFDAEFIAEKTGKPITWRQALNNLKNYERDTMPWDVDHEVRALYELCLVLINSNEFLYVY
ncbi:MAG: PSD1 and planctomycete cytochrome C domain-containing protein, partial [Lentisphaeraceae bacterium]|nr:PSD1 and planctomycete cytochrome C domain-containing protein [Lentisphaeraceae bacterium]